MSSTTLRRHAVKAKISTETSDAAVFKTKMENDKKAFDSTQMGPSPWMHEALASATTGHRLSGHQIFDVLPVFAAYPEHCPFQDHPLDLSVRAIQGKEEVSGRTKLPADPKFEHPPHVIFHFAATSQDCVEEIRRERRCGSVQKDDGERLRDLQQVECDTVGHEKSVFSCTQPKDNCDSKTHVMMGHDEGGANSDEAGDDEARCLRFEKDASARDDSDESASGERRLTERTGVDAGRVTCGSSDQRFLDFSTGGLNRHKLIHSGERHFTCDVCQKSYKRKRHLTSHQRSHSDDRPFTCDVCSKGFTWKSELNGHKKRHFDDRPFACDVCEARFKTKSTLKNHKKKHFDDRPYACDVCGKAFKMKSVLIGHEKRHTDDRPYACDVCEKRFKSQPELTNHMKRHVCDPPYVCDVCGKSFKVECDLISHIKAVHSSVDRPRKCLVMRTLMDGYLSNRIK